MIYLRIPLIELTQCKVAIGCHDSFTVVTWLDSVKRVTCGNKAGLSGIRPPPPEVVLIDVVVVTTVVVVVVLLVVVVVLVVVFTVGASTQ